MNALDHVTAQVRFTDHIGDIIDLNATYNRSTDSAERQRLAEQIADHYEQAARIAASSTFVRTMSAGMDCDPARMRAKAEHWRLYGDPEEDNR